MRSYTYCFVENMPSSVLGVASLRHAQGGVQVRQHHPLGGGGGVVGETRVDHQLSLPGVTVCH